MRRMGEERAERAQRGATRASHGRGCETEPRSAHERAERAQRDAVDGQ
jgi:hypothetical protein